VRSVGKQIVDVPSFLVRVDSQKHIDFALSSPFGGGRPGRVKRRNIRNANKKVMFDPILEMLPLRSFAISTKLN
jgi:hypothetical protein